MNERAELLRRSELFEELDEHALGEVATQATEYDVPAGTVLIEAGVPASGMFVLIAGEVIVETHDGREHRLGAGQAVGELSLLANSVRTGRAQAATDVRALAFDRRQFEALLRAQPAVARALLRVLACRLVEAHAGPR
ncbi:MAG: Crp/Fnr family transcriptional regulator [Gaiellaceae bacterium]